MEHKIRRYVNYQFRFNQQPDDERLKEEMIEAITEDYNIRLKQGKCKKKAFREAIQAKGDFVSDSRNVVPFEFSQKPTFADVLSVVSIISAIVGAILAVFNMSFNTLVLVISLSCYWGGAYYFYASALYARREEYDIPKHHLYLTKAMKYVETNMILWVVSISFQLSRTIAAKIVQRQMRSDIGGMGIFNDYEFLVFLFFLFSAFVFSLLFALIYLKMKRRYKDLTCEVPLEHPNSHTNHDSQ